MPMRLLKKLWKPLYFCGALVILSPIWALESSPVFQICTNPQTYEQPDQGGEKPQQTQGVGQYLDCAAVAIDENHDLVSAIGTIVVAVFTGTLWWSTHKLWRAGEDQRRISRQQTAFSAHAAKAATRQAEISVAVERPIFIEEEVAIQKGDRIYRIKFGNHGRTPAIITADCLVMKIDRSMEKPYRLPLGTVKQKKQGRVVSPKTFYDVERQASISEEDWARVLAGDIPMWAYGYVDYLDFLKEEWREGFCFGCRPVRATQAERMYKDLPTGTVIWERVGPRSLRYTKRKQKAQSEQDAADEAQAAAEAAEDSEA